MYRISVVALQLLALCLVEERNIVCRRSLRMQIFKADIHWPYDDAQLFESRQQIPKVVRGQGQLRRLERSGGKREVRAGEGGMRRWGGGAGGFWAMLRVLADYQGVRQCLFMCMNKVSEVLWRLAAANRERSIQSAVPL